MSLESNLALMRQKGFIFNGLRGFITRDNREQLAMDAAIVMQNTVMATQANSAIPVEYTAYLDPLVIEVLTAPRNAREVFAEVKKGDWTTPYAKFQVDEYVGSTTPYTDYGNGASSDVNTVFPSRQQYIFQTTVRYGDLEQATASVAKINLASRKQMSAARTIDIDANRFYLFGVQGRNIYGLLNEPNLPAALVPSTSTTVAGSTKWTDKSAVEIYNDVMKLFGELAKNSAGNVDTSSDLVLALTPESNVQLGRTTEFGVSAKDMLDKYFGKSLKIVTIPEMSSPTAGNTVLMTARDILGIPTAQLGFSIKMQAGRIVTKTSSFEQKYISSTYGCVLYRPFGVATMTGV